MSTVLATSAFAQSAKGVRGQHKVLIELAHANHKVFPGQFKTVTFTVPDTAMAKMQPMLIWSIITSDRSKNRWICMILRTPAR